MPVNALVAPDARLRVFGEDGQPLNGGLLFTYAAGSSTPQLTYSLNTLAPGSENTNPVVASAGGLFGPIYLSLGVSYKFVLKTSLGVTVWSQDNVSTSSANIATVALGGTGVATLAAHGVLVGNGTSPVAVTGTGSAGQVLTSNGAAADPTFQSVSSPATFSSGMGMPFFGSSAAVPVGWLFCNGAAVSRATYANLFAVVGVTYGIGDGATTFNIPEGRGRYLMGVATSGTGNTLGSTFGTIDHLHAGPSHTHTGPSHTHTGPSHTHTVGDHVHGGTGHTHGAGSFAVSGNTSQATNFTGGSPQSGTDSVTHDHTFAASVTGTSAAGGDVNSQGVVGGAFASGAGGTGATGADGTGATGASGTGNTGTANPPTLASNWIIKT